MTLKTPVVSIIVPTYQLEDNVGKFCDALNRQTADPKFFEVIFIDDASRDRTINIIEKYPFSCCSPKIHALPVNCGPGAARNVGILRSSGEYIIFADGDDQLASNAIERIVQAARQDRTDAIAYNFLKYDSENNILGNTILAQGSRRDTAAIMRGRSQLINDDLEMKCDGSVIYTAMRRSTILRNDICFRPGFHEDIDFIFKFYCKMDSLIFVNEILYYKYNRPNSIVNTINVKHIDGYLSAWAEIRSFLVQEHLWEQRKSSYVIGLSGIIGVIVMKIVKQEHANGTRFELLNHLAVQLAALHEDYVLMEPKRNESRYDKIAIEFLSIFRSHQNGSYEKLSQFVESVTNEII